MAYVSVVQWGVGCGSCLGRLADLAARHGGDDGALCALSRSRANARKSGQTGVDVTTRAAEIVKQGLRELAQEEAASVGEVLAYAGAANGAELSTGGGASFPPEWTIGANGDLSIAPSAGAMKSLEVLQAPGAGGDTLAVVNVDNDGGIILGADGQIELRNAEGNDMLIIDPDDQLLMGIGSGLQVTANGYTKIVGFGAEPPDGDLFGGEMILWFDRTDGAAKLMMKAKSQDGTVVQQQASFPDEWTVGADGALAIEPTDVNAVPLTITGPAGHVNDLLDVLSAGGGFMIVYPSGQMQINPEATNPSLVLNANAGANGIVFEVDSQLGANLMTVRQAGQITTLANAALPDGAIANGECSLWFDSTNGAAKLMVKAKQADGTVRTGNLALT